MAEAVEVEIENALSLVVSTAEQSTQHEEIAEGKIFDTATTLRQLFVKIKISGDRNLSEISNLTKKVSKLETELQSCREKQAEVQQTPSVNDINEQRGTRARLHGAPSIGSTPVPAEVGVQRVVLPSR